MDQQSILGTWETEARDTEWGKAKCQLAFGVDGKLTFRFIPVGDESDSSAMERESSFKISKGYLIADVLNKGNPVTIWFEGDDLVLQYDDQYRERCRRVHP